MDKDGEQGPDAASIKPVSSLRAKFEGLQTQGIIKPESDSAIQSPAALKHIELPRPSPLVRASLDLPRPQSPWSTNADAGGNPPQTPGSQGRSSQSQSPTRSGHRRGMSLLANSSPQMTPAVKVESPRSPPRTYFNRSPSRSPERLLTSSIGKVKEIISQHSSRESTRPSTPGVEEPTGNPAVSKDVIGLKSAEGLQRSKSPIPPPINRAEKPKIPAKPQTVNLASKEEGLTMESAVHFSDPRVSPFSTPPSSDDDSAPSRASDRPSRDPAPKIPTARRESSKDGSMSQSSTRPTDPRFMGFGSASSAITERRDPRLLGFSPLEPPRPPSRDTKPGTSPARAPAIPDKSLKDARELGFGSASSKPRNVVEITRPPPASMTKQDSLPMGGSARDARQFGFSRSATTPIQLEEGKPELPSRPVARVPPPRPSEDSKRPAYHPGIMRAATSKPAPPTSVDHRPKISSDVPRQIIPAASDLRYPPPPKRNTFNDADDVQILNGPPAREKISSTTSTPIENTSSAATWRDESDEDENDPTLQDSNAPRHDYPDATQTNRRPPLYPSTVREINGKADGKVFDICGQYLCTASYITRVFDMTTGEAIMGLNHGETVKITAAIFKPGASADTEGTRLWLGNNVGDLQEVDIETHTVVSTSSVHNRREIFRIFRYQKDLWTLDDDGKLFVWPDEGGSPSLKHRYTSYKTTKGPTFALVVQNKLWIATGKEIRVYRPGNESSFNVLKSPLLQSGNGDVTSGTFSPEGGGKVYIGHTDGKVSIYSNRDYSCTNNLKISDYKINGLAFVGNRLWTVFKTGKAYVYDTSSMPWKVNKDWRAHDGPATGVVLDPSSVWTLQRMQVATAGHDGFIRLWDGMLEEDWIENEMHKRDSEYCKFREIRAAITTWNCGAVSPAMLRNVHFIADAIHADEAEPPEILVFGFQEVVDLEDRTVTAKSLLFGKKKDPTKAEQHQSRIYREWRDYLKWAIEKFCPHHYYTEVHMSSLIGLFQCVFVRDSIRDQISNQAAVSVKCGMGGHYGNKGALVSRFVVDDSSLCFINCHLAAGQTQTAHRNNDVATILESDHLTPERNLDTRMSLYVGGGDGTQILDHEICILNGDLNYRIDAIPRNIVIDMIKRNDLSKLLERDQLNVSRKRVSGFRLAPFRELPITFPPTYKYDVGKDTYDSSDKKRSPAWCDRLLYRGFKGRVKQLEYIRHEGVRHSDHRPVSGVFKIEVKRVDVTKRDKVKEDCYKKFTAVKKKMQQAACVGYLVDYLGVSPAEAERLITTIT